MGSSLAQQPLTHQRHLLAPLRYPSRIPQYQIQTMMPPAKFQVVFLNGEGQCSFPDQFPLVTPAYFLRPPPHDGFQPPSQASQHFSMESIQLDQHLDRSLRSILKSTSHTSTPRAAGPLA
ncbi:hypothetical protein BCR44DRAFT_1022123 [Catenaria anguillulae PL171]|uniref:Uncharacterized protein n=1 Tax=Catenaria anguillulae PL171 TaxID=765915 RepID=A0A1Y2H6A4_9FUNG|nr:hypothetical protein BCR44DRAFT_1022123 [Catenaria anguillulae PL171]